MLSQQGGVWRVRRLVHRSVTSLKWTSCIPTSSIMAASSSMFGVMTRKAEQPCLNIPEHTDTEAAWGSSLCLCFVLFFFPKRHTNRTYVWFKMCEPKSYEHDHPPQGNVNVDVVFECFCFEGQLWRKDNNNTFLPLPTFKLDSNKMQITISKENKELWREVNALSPLWTDDELSLNPVVFYNRSPDPKSEHGIQLDMCRNTRGDLI